MSKLQAKDQNKKHTVDSLFATENDSAKNFPIFVMYSLQVKQLFLNTLKMEQNKFPVFKSTVVIINFMMHNSLEMFVT